MVLKIKTECILLDSHWFALWVIYLPPNELYSERAVY